MATRQIVNNRATTPVSVPEITRIQVEGNDTVSFLYGAAPPYQWVRGMSQIMEQNPAYISYRYDTITISQVAGESFTFTVYSITDVGGNTFVPLTSLDTSDVVARKTQEVYRLLVTAIFKGCCECGNTEPECSIQYTAGNGEVSGTLLIDSGAARINYFTANNQDFTGFWPIIQDGSWIFIFSKTDPTVYGVFQLSNYTDGGPGIYAQFDITLLAGTDVFPEGTELCVDVTSVGGSLVQGWQDTLIIDSVLTQDNTVDGGNFNFVFDNNNSFVINSPGGSIETDISGSSLIAGTQSITVNGSYIDIITPNYAAATTGMVLALDASGHIEYTLAGTGTISSIGLFMPPAFTVSTPNPLTSNGSFTVTGAGTALEYIDGTGNLQTFPVYTVENGLHTKELPADPYVFHLGGVLIEDTVITATEVLPGPAYNEWVLGVSGLVGQDTRQPLAASNLGNGGVAVFADYASGARPNPSVQMITDNDLFNPILTLSMQGDLPNPAPVLADRTTLLRLRYDGTQAVGARMSIDYQFRDDDPTPAYFIAGRLTTEITDMTLGDEQSLFELQLYDQGSRQTKLQVTGPGQLILDEYGPAIFSDGTTNIDNSLSYVLATDNTGRVWKKLATGGGSVTSVGATGLLTTTATNPFTTSGVVTSEMNSGFLVGRYDAGLGVFQEIALGTNLSLVGNTLNATGGGAGFDVQVNTTTIIPPATILNLKSGTDINVVNEGGGNVRFDWAGATPLQGLQDVIIVDNVLTQDNTVQGSITSFLWKSNSFYEINPVTNYDPGTGTVPGYFKAHVGKYPPSYSELYVEAIYAQMKSTGATDQVVKVDTTGVYVQTPALGSASNGYVLTLVDQATGKAEWQVGGGGPGTTYDGNEGIYKDTTLANDTFQLGYLTLVDSQLVGNEFTVNRYISTGTNKLNIYGVAASSDGIFYVQNTSTNAFAAGILSVNSSSTVASSKAIEGRGENGTGVLGLTKSSSAYGGRFGTISSTQDTIKDVVNVFSTALGGGQVGLGGDILFSMSNDNSISFNAGRVGYVATSVINTGEGEASKFFISTKESGTAQPIDRLEIDTVGQVKFNKYGQTPANFPDASPVWALGVNSTGNVVEFTPSGGGLKSGDATQVLPGEYETTIAGVTSLAAGDTFMIKFDSVNENGSTLKINTLPAYDIFKNTDVKIASGDIKAGQEITIAFDGTAFQAIGLVTNQLLAYVHNAEGAVITKGQAVYAFGASGDKMSVKLAMADADATSAKTIGLVYDSSIGIGGEGYIIIQGVIEGINTAAFTAGDTLYLSGSVPGGYVSTPTYAPVHRVYVGIVEKANAGNGQIYVRCQNGYELDEIHDVDLVTTPPVNNDVLVFDTSTTPDLWKAKSIPTILGYTPQDSSYPSYTVKANNTGVTATATDHTFRYPGNQVFNIATTPITYSTGGAPSTFGSGTYFYNWTRIGNTVNFTFYFYNPTAITWGTANSGYLYWSLPSDMPNPFIPSGVSSNGNWLARGFMSVVTAQNTTAGQSTWYGGLQVDVSAAPSFRMYFIPAGVTTNGRLFSYTGTYFTS